MISGVDGHLILTESFKAEDIFAKTTCTHTSQTCATTTTGTATCTTALLLLLRWLDIHLSCVRLVNETRSPYWLLWCISTATTVWLLLRSVSLSAVCLWWGWADLLSVEKMYIRLYIRIVTTLLTTLVVILYGLRCRNAQ